MINSETEDAQIIAVLEKVYNELPHEIVAYDALRDNTIALANIYDIIYKVQNDYRKELEQSNENDDYIRQQVIKELYPNPSSSNISYIVYARFK